MKATEWTEAFASGKMDDKLSLLYGNAKVTLEQQRQRYVDAIQAFTELYPEREDLYIYSAPGRTEVGGNHTDHQHGCVLAAAVNLDAIAIVSFHEDQVIRLKSANYPQDLVLMHTQRLASSAAAGFLLPQHLKCWLERLSTSITTKEKQVLLRLQKSDSMQKTGILERAAV